MRYWRLGVEGLKNLKLIEVLQVELCVPQIPILTSKPPVPQIVTWFGSRVRVIVDVIS